MNKQKKPLYFYYLLILIVIVAGNMLFSAMEQSRIKDVSYNTFIKQTEQKKIDKVEIGDQSISYTLKRMRRRFIRRKRWKRIPRCLSGCMMPGQPLQEYTRRK